MSSQQKMPSFGSASDSFLKGEFAVLEGLNEYIDTYWEQWSTAIKEVTDSLRTDIRDKAASTPGWKQFEENLDVVFEDGDWVYVLVGDPAKVQAAYDLEFGTPDRPPRSLLRVAALKTEKTSKALTKKLSEGVPVA